VKDDGVAVVQKSSIRRRQTTAGRDDFIVADRKRFATRTDEKIFRFEK
jgi:hypothetical protein